MKKTLAALFAVASIGLAGAASATTISFEVDNAFTTGPLSFSDGGFTVNASAGYVAGGGAHSSTREIASFAGPNGGLGACYGAAANGCVTGHGSDSEHTVDGRGTPDVIILDFGSDVVTITELGFSFVDRDDSFGIAALASYDYSVNYWNADIDATEGGMIGPDSGESGSAVAGVDFGAITGSIFAIVAPGTNDGWLLESISFTNAQQVQDNARIAPVPSVPLPAGGVLLLAGLAGAAAVTRRKRG